MHFNNYVTDHYFSVFLPSEDSSKSFQPAASHVDFFFFYYYYNHSSSSTTTIIALLLLLGGSHHLKQVNYRPLVPGVKTAFSLQLPYS